MSENSRKIVLEVKNRQGIHARPAAMIVRIANKFSGQVWVEKDGERVNGKSILGVMGMAAAHGMKLTFHAECEEPDAFCEEIAKLFANNFQEG